MNYSRSSKSCLRPRGVQSVLFVPLITAVNLHGWLVIQTGYPLPVQLAEIELARTMSNQAAVALQKCQVVQPDPPVNTGFRAAVDARTREVGGEHNNTQALLKVITELSSSLT